MTIAVSQTPFGVVEFGVSGVDDLEWRESAGAGTLPAGMRVDGGVVISARVELLAGDTVSISLACNVKDGLEAALDTGEALDRHSVGDAALSGAFAMRDGDWFERRPGLRLDSFEGGHCRSLYTLTALETTSLIAAAAAAWTLKPTTEQERTSPWFAVDHVLPD